jgi:hypothetical protein
MTLAESDRREVVPLSGGGENDKKLKWNVGEKEEVGLQTCLQSRRYLPYHLSLPILSHIYLNYPHHRMFKNDLLSVTKLLKNVFE